MTMKALTNLFSKSSNVDIGTNAPQLSNVLTVISPRRRRLVLDIIHERRSIEFSDLVDLVAASESSGESVSSAERNRVYTSLYQTHIPKLANNSVIEYNSKQKHINATEKLDAIYSATSDFTEALHNAPVEFE